MLENIIKTLQSEVGGQIVNRTGISPDKLDGVFSIIGEVAGKEVSGKMMGGDLSTVMNLFSNKKNNNSANQLQSNITSGVVGKLISKLGLSDSLASTIANIAVPALIGLITKKNNETPDNDSSALTELFGGKEEGPGEPLL